MYKRLLRIAFGASLLIGIGTAALAGTDDRAAAESVLKEVEASPKKAAAGELVARSRTALERGTRLRAGGNETHARMADSVAKAWAEAARDVVRAAAVEESAAATRAGATDAGLLADRERALLEEAIAQSGRLRAQMESASHAGKEEPARTSKQANQDAGVTPPAPKRGDAGK